MVETDCKRNLFANGCPFSKCKTKGDMIETFARLRKDPEWSVVLDKMGSCPLFKKSCPINSVEYGFNNKNNNKGFRKR